MESSEAAFPNAMSSKHTTTNNFKTMFSKPNQSKDPQFTQPTNSKKHMSGGHTKGVFLAASEGKEKCAYCTSIHKLYTCANFKNLSVGDRINFVREAKLCFNCLYPSHTVDKCKSRFSCFVCKGKHNTLLHYERQNKPSTEDKSGEESASSSNQGSTLWF